MGALVLLVLLAAGWRVWAMGTPLFPVDDAYITLNNVRDLLGQTVSPYAEASPLHGATSALHLVAIAAFAWLLPTAWAQLIVAVLAAVAYALGAFRLATVQRAPAPVAFLLALLALLVAETPHQLLNGLETGLALAVITWALVAAVDPRLSGGRLLPLLCGLMPFVRPELVALSGLLLLSWAHAHWKQGASRQERAQRLLRGGAWVLCGAAPFLLLYLVTTGAPWPSTVSAKKHFFAEGCLPWSLRWRVFEVGIRGFLTQLGVLGAALLLLPWTRLGRLGLVFIAVFAGAYATTFPSAVSHYEHRYLYVVVPLLLWALAALGGSRWRGARLAGVAVLVLALAQSLAHLPARLRAHVARVNFTRIELAGVAEWARAHLPAGTRLLVHDAGYIAVDSPFAIVDLVGLKTPSNADVHAQVTWPSCGRGRITAVDVIALAERTDYFVVLDGWDTVYEFTLGLREHGWRVERVDTERPKAAYGVYRLTPPSGSTASGSTASGSTASGSTASGSTTAR